MSGKRSKTIRQRLGAVLAYFAWKAGIQYSPDRGFVGFGWDIQPPNEANDCQSREEIIRKAQEFERNNPIVNRLADVFELYTVGAGGMPVIPASDDEEWNANRKMLWEIWCRYPDLTSLQSFGTLQSLMARRWFIDGQVFIFKTRSDTKVRQEGPDGRITEHYRPRIQLIEAARVRTPSKLSARNDIVDGAQVDGRGRPVGYWVANSTSRNRGVYGYETSEEFTFIEAKDMIVVGEPMRPNEYRPMSFLAPAINDLQDLEELMDFAMRKAKKNGSINLVYKTESGELPTSQSIRQRALLDQSTETADGTQILKNKVETIERITGSKSVALKVGEELDELGAKSPNEIEMAHWDVRMNRICAAVGIAKQLVFPYSIQGTIGRADLDVANGFFRAKSAVLQDAIVQIYEYVTGEEIRFTPLIADAPRTWKKCAVRPPRGCNVDVGRNSAATLAELDAGATNYDLIYGPLGLDAKEELRKSAMFAKYIRDLAKEFKVEPGEIRLAVNDVLKSQMEKENQNQKQEDDTIPA